MCLLFLHPVPPRIDALHAKEEFAERRGVCKMEVVGCLGDAHRGGLQQEGSLHQEHLIDIIDEGASSDLAYLAGEIDRRDVELDGIERDVVALGVLQVEQEDGIEHSQHLAFIDMVGMKISYRDDNIVGNANTFREVLYRSFPKL